MSHDTTVTMVEILDTQQPFSPNVEKTRNNKQRKYEVAIFS